MEQNDPQKPNDGTHFVDPGWVTDAAVKYTTRPSWDEYFMRIAVLVASRSTCIRRNVGAIIVKEKRILASGYNGAPRCLKHCFELPEKCLRESRKIPSGERQELCRGLHAEQNAILQAAAFGVPLKGGQLYCTHQPCVICAKMILNTEISRVTFLGDYPDSLALEMLNEGNIELHKMTLEGKNG
ncbi:MAG: cytidine/deoxycytidylate deaminase family protein [Candidatus Riflebacteria bacterium]|nr:cytidine/deoxycytidylate deaminase family protein [Candidatus Riflebacteria bacterium]